jgi:aspartyl-tRNA(Asn)/glutamyl-tRNA(Gln) amidotransferase subunit C
VAVTNDDVRHIAELARVGVSPDRLDDLVRELNGILEHMGVLAQVETPASESDPSPSGRQPECTPLRSDSSGPIPLLLPLESFAPSTRDGFITVPRLASHDDPVDSTP